MHDPDLIRPPDHVTTYQISADGSVGESQKAPSLFSIEKGTRRQVQKGKDSPSEVKSRDNKARGGRREREISLLRNKSQTHLFFSKNED